MNYSAHRPSRIAPAAIGFSMKPTINMRGLPPHLVQRIAKTNAEFIAKFGEDPGTLAQAAAHEAGHLIVAVALGGQPRRARIFSQTVNGREVWAGENRVRWRWSAEAYPFEIASDIPRGIIEMSSALAGIVGEAAARLDHPSSSVDERCIASMGIGEIARLLGKPAATMASLIEAVATTSIETNRSAFDALRELLQRRRSLERDMIAPALQEHGARQIFDADAMVSEIESEVA